MIQGLMWNGVRDLFHEGEKRVKDRNRDMKRRLDHSSYVAEFEQDHAVAR